MFAPASSREVMVGSCRVSPVGGSSCRRSGTKTGFGAVRWITRLPAAITVMMKASRGKQPPSGWTCPCGGRWNPTLCSFKTEAC